MPAKVGVSAAQTSILDQRTAFVERLFVERLFVERLFVEMLFSTRVQI